MVVWFDRIVGSGWVLFVLLVWFGVATWCVICACWVFVFWSCAIYLFDLVVGWVLIIRFWVWFGLRCYCFTFDYLFAVVGA